MKKSFNTQASSELAGRRFNELINDKGVDSPSVKQMYAMAGKFGTQKNMTKTLESMAFQNSTEFSCTEAEIAMSLINKYQSK